MNGQINQFNRTAVVRAFKMKLAREKQYVCIDKMSINNIEIIPDNVLKDLVREVTDMLNNPARDNVFRYYYKVVISVSRHSYTISERITNDRHNELENMKYTFIGETAYNVLELVNNEIDKGIKLFKAVSGHDDIKVRFTRIQADSLGIAVTDNDNNLLVQYSLILQCVYNGDMWETPADKFKSLIVTDVVLEIDETEKYTTKSVSNALVQAAIETIMAYNITKN